MTIRPALLAAAVGATLATVTPSGGALAADGSATVVVQVSDATVTEGNAGLTTMTFEIRRINPDTGRKSTVSYATHDGTATQGQDYVATSGTVTFDAKHNVFDINVSVIGDTVQEPDEYFTFDVTPTGGGDPSGRGTILNDDGWPAG
jgi:hypothetical protein